MAAELLISGIGELPKNKPYLVFERSDGNVLLRDSGVHPEILLNGERLGGREAAGGPVMLRRGENTLTLAGSGGVHSFLVLILSGDDAESNSSYSSCMAQMTPAVAFYIRLCLYTKDLIRSGQYSGQALVERAVSVGKRMTADQDLLWRLYCYAADPETFSDLVVAHSVNVAIYA